MQINLKALYYFGINVYKYLYYLLISTILQRTWFDLIWDTNRNHSPKVVRLTIWMFNVNCRTSVTRVRLILVHIWNHPCRIMEIRVGVLVVEVLFTDWADANTNLDLWERKWSRERRRRWDKLRQPINRSVTLREKPALLNATKRRSLTSKTNVKNFKYP